MSEITAPAPTSAGSYLAGLLAGQSQQASSPLAWLNALRRAAVERVGVLALPTTRDEEWRFTEISPLTRMSFGPAQSVTPLEVGDVTQFFIEEAATRLVFIDGIYTPQLSIAKGDIGADSGVVVSNLSAAIAAHATRIEPHLGRHAAFDNDAFTAQNTAFLHDAAVVLVPPDIAVAAPVHLLFIATQKDVVSTPRCLVVAGAGSVVTVIEDYVVLYQPRWQEEAHFTNAVTEIALADNARVNHVRVQREGSQAFHIANCAVALGRASNYQSVSVALGARISRYNLKGEETKKIKDIEIVTVSKVEEVFTALFG